MIEREKGVSGKLHVQPFRFGEILELSFSISWGFFFVVDPAECVERRSDGAPETIERLCLVLEFCLRKKIRGTGNGIERGKLYNVFFWIKQSVADQFAYILN